MPSSQDTDRDPADAEMQRSYLRVLLVWIVTLAGLYAAQEYFAAR